MLFPKHEEMIQAFPFDSPNKPFSIGIKVWRAIRNPFDLGVMGFEQFIKLLGELGIAIPDKKLPGFIPEEEGEALCGIDYPFFIRLCSNPGYMHLWGSDINKE